MARDPGPGPMDGNVVESTFAADAASVMAIRRFVASIAGSRATDLELVTSELATNAVQHGEGPLTVRVERCGESVRVAVHDLGDRYPAVAHVGADSPRGRGLAIVAKAASDWGVETDGVGKWVWAEVSSGR